MEPALTAIVAYWWLGETMTPAQWGGAVLILLGVVVLRLGGMRKRRSAQKWSEAQQVRKAEQVSES
jgi:drug/metabolite transporter (DMT)-like permease